MISNFQDIPPYRYHAFGMEIESQIALPELLPGNAYAKVNLSIIIGKVPLNLNEAIFSGVWFQTSPGKFLLTINKVARYLITKGNKIIVEPHENGTENDIRLFLLGSALGALFHQLEFLPIHGSALVYNNKAIVFSGLSGVGKSTLAMSFLKMGFQIITDDICMISLSENKVPMAFPSYPQMKLWSDSLDKLSEDKTSLKKIQNDILKFAIPLQGHFRREPVELAGLYVIQTKNTPEFNIETLKGIEKFNVIKNNTYRLNFIKGLGTTESHFKLVEAITRHCFVKTISRPIAGFQLTELTNFIENDFKNDLR